MDTVQNTVLALLVVGGFIALFAGNFVLGLILIIVAIGLGMARDKFPNDETEVAEATIKSGNKSITESTNKKCPFCAETIKQEAVICRFCNRDVPPQVKPIIELITAQTYLKSINDGDKATYEKYAQMRAEERKSACFACHGEDSACEMCDFRESTLKHYLEAKQKVATTAQCIFCDKEIAPNVDECPHCQANQNFELQKG